MLVFNGVAKIISELAGGVEPPEGVPIAVSGRKVYGAEYVEGTKTEKFRRANLDGQNAEDVVIGWK